MLIICVGFLFPTFFGSVLIIKAKRRGGGGGRGEERGGNFSPNSGTALFVNVMGSQEEKSKQASECVSPRERISKDVLLHPAGIGLFFSSVEKGKKKGGNNQTIPWPHTPRRYNRILALRGNLSQPQLKHSLTSFKSDYLIN